MKWEYRFVDVQATTWTNMASLLNGFGASGWELVTHDSINQTLIFKRPLPEPQP